jgi:hypothetical protein
MLDPSTLPDVFELMHWNVALGGEPSDLLCFVLAVVTARS